MSLRFRHETLPQTVLFGTGEARENLTAEVERRGARRVMVIASEGSELVDQLIADIRSPVRFTDVAQHVPIEIAERAREVAGTQSVDLLVSIGGGSTTGLAKAVALTSGIPIVAVPTTYAGSEATDVWGLTGRDHKTTGVDRRVLPATVIYDAELTLTLPVDLSMSSGLNAVAHSVDSLWAPRADPINSALGLEGIRALGPGLRGIRENSQSLAAREQTLYGTYLAAVAFASAGSGMHHKICHVLGGTFGLPHAQTHAVILPYVLAFNLVGVPEVAGRLAEAFQAPDAVSGLSTLDADLGAPRSLAEIGFTEDSIPDAARRALAAIPASNPRAVTLAGLEHLLRQAWAGEHPSDLPT